MNESSIFLKFVVNLLKHCMKKLLFFKILSSQVMQLIKIKSKTKKKITKIIERSQFYFVVVVVSGASLNTDIGPDSEAQIAPQHGDYDKEYDHEQDHLEQSADIKEKHNGHNGAGDVKTNTPV